MERQKFDGEWRKTFDQAEVSPSDTVWTNIELDLEKAKGSQLKKSLVFYQLLAAASVVLSIGIGVGVYVMDKDISSTAMPLAVQSSQPAAVEKENALRAIAGSDNSAQENLQNDKNTAAFSNPALADVQKEMTSVESRQNNSSTSSFSADRSNEKAFTASYDHSEKDGMRLSEAGMKLPALVVNRKIQFQRQQLQPKQPTIAVDHVAMMMARLEQREREVREMKEEKKEMSEKLWTSVGFAAGSFTPVNAGVSSPPPTSALAMNKPGADEEAKAPGTTYTVGVNLGTKISDRWVVQGGVNYLTQSSDYTARSAVAVENQNNATTFRPQSINELSNLSRDAEEFSASDESIIPTAPYNVNNNLRYLSIPIQAGYLLINKEFGLQLNAGIAADLFLQNTVTGGENLDKTTLGIGEDSPYRAVNLSGLMGTEVSYRFGEHYRLALNPGIRYPFNSIYRSDINVKATPLSFDVGLRFRYIFH